MGTTLPEQGISDTALLSYLAALQKGDVNWAENRAFGLVYPFSEEHTAIIKAAHNLYQPTNGLNPVAFKSLHSMEHDVVRITANLFHGSDTVVGTMTSGGTESILLAVLAYRQWARKHRPWIRRPEIVLPESAHAAFYKAGAYFDVKMITCPLDKDYKADIGAMSKYITQKTIALVGSAPCYPYGVVDPIEDIGSLGIEREIPVHVDACLGGYFLPFLEILGKAESHASFDPYDFRVPGVTSISADLHKYGYAAKGASVILYRDMHYLRHQFSVATDWCGGIYVSPSLAGTRPGGNIAAAWASLHALGRNGYVQNARKMVQIARYYIQQIEAIPGLSIIGNPVMPVLAFGSRNRGLSIYAVGDYLEAKGWHIDRLQHPESLHLILNPGHATVADNFLADLRQAVIYVQSHREAAYNGSAPMYGLVAKAPLRKMVKHQVMKIVEQMYGSSGGGSDPALSVSPGDTPLIKNPTFPPVMRALMKIWGKFTFLWH